MVVVFLIIIDPPLTLLGPCCTSLTSVALAGAAFLAFFGFISFSPAAAAGAIGFFSSAKLRPATETLKKAVITTIPNFFIIASNHPFPGFDITDEQTDNSYFIVLCMRSAKHPTSKTK